MLNNEAHLHIFISQVQHACGFGLEHTHRARVTQVCAQPDWGYFEWTEQIISINPYKLIQPFFVMILKNIFIFSK
jgi:hypothetical protein